MSKFVTNPPFQRVIPPDYKKPWRLHSDLFYQSDELDYVLVVPKGYRTDFASIPWVFRRLFPQDGPWTLAAVVHDWLCDQRDPDVDHKKTAKVFLEAMEVLNVGKKTRKIMYRAVLWFGPKW